jgi:hypothetical protein
LQGDADGDGLADLEIILHAVAAPLGSDLVL